MFFIYHIEIDFHNCSPFDCLNKYFNNSTLKTKAPWIIQSKYYLVILGPHITGFIIFGGDSYARQEPKKLPPLSQNFPRPLSSLHSTNYKLQWILHLYPTFNAKIHNFYCITNFIRKRKSVVCYIVWNLFLYRLLLTINWFFWKNFSKIIFVLV